MVPDAAKADGVCWLVDCGRPPATVAPAGIGWPVAMGIAAVTAAVPAEAAAGSGGGVTPKG